MNDHTLQIRLTKTAARARAAGLRPCDFDGPDSPLVLWLRQNARYRPEQEFDLAFCIALTMATEQ